MSRDAFSKRSGGIEGRPIALYISSNAGDSSANAASASIFTPLSGCFAGTTRSGESTVSIVACFFSVPRIDTSCAQKIRSEFRCRSPPGFSATC